LLLTVIAFTFFLSISAQVSAPPAIGVKITSPVKGQEVLTKTTTTTLGSTSVTSNNTNNNNLIVSGTSTDDVNTDCQVSVIVNNVKPYQPAVANGTGGTNDYSKWNFMITPTYTTIKEGPNNKITSKLECTPNLTKWYSVNVTGIIPSTITTSSTPSPSSLSDTIASVPQLEQKRNRTNPTTTSSSTSPTSISFNASMLNITSPATDQEIPSGSKIALFGTSMDDFYKDCKVYTKKNDLPYQKVTAAGLTGSGDYSVWKFSYEDRDNDEYSKITLGNTNNITAMISCSNIDQKTSAPESSKIFINKSTTAAATTTAYATLNLIGINQPPLAVAHTEKKEVKEGEEITLDGEKSSDPNGDLLTYFWKHTGGFVNGIDIINPDDAIAQFKMPDDLIEDTTFSFELTVEDGYGKTSTDIINIDAIANTKPVSNAGKDIQAKRGEEVILDGTDSYDPDPTGKVISYFWAANSNGDNEDGGRSSRYLQDSNQPVAQFSVPLVQEDTTFEFTLTVIDDEGAEDNSKMKVKVKGNSKPMADAGSHKEAAIGEQVTLDGGGSHDPDPTGQIVSYTWEQTGGSTSINLNGVNTPKPTFTVPKLGEKEEEHTTFEFTLTVIDDEGAEDRDKTEVKVEAPVSEPQLLSPVEQQQSLPDEQQKKQVQHEKEAEDEVEEEGEGEEEEEEEEDENNGVADILPMPPSYDVIRIPDVIDLFS
jgi:PKD domain